MSTKNLIIVINSGSSSLKYKVFDKNDNLKEVAGGIAQEIGKDNSKIKHVIYGRKIELECKIPDHKTSIELVFNLLFRGELSCGQGNDKLSGDTKGDMILIKDKKDIHAVSHRVVHGGDKFNDVTMVTKEVLNDLKEISSLAPLHNKINIDGVMATMEIIGDEIPQYLVFDTSFNLSIPTVANLYGIPLELSNELHIRKYGFHGISHKYVAKMAANYLNRNINELKIISIHLGNGSSVSAINNGISVDNSMGLTPLEGLIMGTRCGDIDASVIFHLMRVKNYSIDDVENLLNKKSGLLGICGTSDMREIIDMSKSEDKNKRNKSEVAIDMYCYHIRKYIGSYIAVLGGLDIIILTGGIGENSSYIREKIFYNLGYLGIYVMTYRDQDDQSRRLGRDCKDQIQSIDIKDKSKVRVLVVPTNEELEIASQTP